MAQEFTNIALSGWEVVRKLGKGGFGSVYEIQRTLPGGYVEKAALKKLVIPKDQEEIEELRSQSFSEESITAHYSSQLEDLVKEYQMMQFLNGCPNIVNCHDLEYIQHEDGIGWDIYIRMELLKPLKEVLGEIYQEETVLKLGLDLCDALVACHSRNIIHRDIKPGNILASENGTFKLGDFGIAKISEKTGTGTMAGTLDYMAPEVAMHKHYGFSADICSLGLVMYWMMNKQTLPFLPLSGKIPSPVQKEEAVRRRCTGEALPEPVNGSRELKRIVLKACAFDPKERYHSAAEMKEALLQIQDRTEKPVGAFSNGKGTIYHQQIEDDQTLLQKEQQAQKRAEEQRRQEEERRRREREDERIHKEREEEKMRKDRNKIFFISIGVCICLLVVALLTVIALLILIKYNTVPTAASPDNPLEDTKYTIPQETMHNHIWKAATCTTPKTCTICGTTSGSEAGHQWIEATYNDPKTCQVCGASAGSKKNPESSLGLRDIIASASASSVFSGDGLDGHEPEKMYDGKLNTNWTEGVSGNGIGENVTFYFDDTYAVKQFKIYIGSHFSEGVYRQNCRPKVVTLTFSDGSTERVRLDDTYDEQTVTFDRYYYTNSIKLTIDDVYTGIEYLDTVIAELDFVAYRP